MSSSYPIIYFLKCLLKRFSIFLMTLRFCSNKSRLVSLIFIKTIVPLLYIFICVPIDLFKEVVIIARIYLCLCRLRNPKIAAILYQIWDLAKLCQRVLILLFLCFLSFVSLQNFLFIAIIFSFHALTYC